MVKHNNVVPNGHFHKDWENRVKTWFNQVGKNDIFKDKFIQMYHVGWQEEISTINT